MLERDMNIFVCHGDLLIDGFDPAYKDAIRTIIGKWSSRRCSADSHGRGAFIARFRCQDGIPLDDMQIKPRLHCWQWLAMSRANSFMRHCGQRVEQGKGTDHRCGHHNADATIGSPYGSMNYGAGFTALRVLAMGHCSVHAVAPLVSNAFACGSYTR